MPKQVQSVGFLALVLLGLLSQVAEAQIPAACADRDSLQEMTCCPLTASGVCGEDAGSGECAPINFERHSNTTTDVRANWPHYYTRACKCNGNYGGYDCSGCKIGYYGQDCSSRAIMPRKPLWDFSGGEWREFVAILRMAKSQESRYVVVLEERVPGTADLDMTSTNLYDLMIWLHHYTGKDATDFFAPVFLDYGHIGPVFYMWHRWFHVFLETEIQAMLQERGRQDYYKFRLPYWDWRGEIQRSYGLPSEELFTFSRFGETRNDSNRPVVFGDLVGNDWSTICHATVQQICNPRISTGVMQRCPFIGNPILCHSSNPDWPTLQEVNEVIELRRYDAEPFDISSGPSLRATADFPFVDSTEECRQDTYCTCVPGGPHCEGIPENATVRRFTAGVHAKVHFLIGIGGAEIIPSELQGNLYDIAGAPNDPVFFVQHLMLDCIFQEWMRRHPGSGYPVHPLIRDGHRIDDYLRTFFPLITNRDVFVNPEEFGYYCHLPNVGVQSAVAPSPLETSMSFFITGGSVDVCVETKTAAVFKLVLRDTNGRRYVQIVQGPSGCGTFTGLPPGQHAVRAISREKLPGLRGKKFRSGFHYFSTQ
jgi:hypothetical protein